MDHISWSTVGVSTGLSAIVSAFVALLADFFARPGLEARKERILERYRAKREFRGLLSRVVVASSSMLSPAPANMTAAQQELYTGEVAVQRESVVALSRDLQNRSVDFLLYESPRVRKLTSWIVGSMRGVAISDKEDQQAAAEILVLTSPLMDLLALSRWHYLKRRSLRRMAEKLIAPSPTG